MDKKIYKKLIENKNFSLNDMKDKISFVLNILSDSFKKYVDKKTFNASQKIKDIITNNKNTELLYHEIKLIIQPLSDNSILKLCRFFSYHELLTNLVEDIYQTSFENKWEIEYIDDDGYLFDFFNNFKRTKDNLEKLDNIFISVVLTAHPTQILRETTLKITRKIIKLLDFKSNYEMKLLNTTSDIKALIDILWQVAILRDEKVTIESEIKSVLNYFDTTFFTILPKINFKFNQLKKRSSVFDINDKIILSLGSWIGGDRDGNHFVTDESLDNAVNYQIRKLFTFYFEKLKLVYDDLLLHKSVTTISNSLKKFIKDVNLPNRKNEPYARAISKINTKIYNTILKIDKNNNIIHPSIKIIDFAGSYISYTDLIKDLDIVLESLKNNNSYEIALRNLVDLIYAVKIFKFHLMTIDVRQNSKVHMVVVDELLREMGFCSNYLKLSDQEREEMLTEILEKNQNFAIDDLIISKESKSEIKIFKKIHFIRKNIGLNSIENYLISNCESFSNILEVYFLYKVSNGKNNEDFLNVIPLFETIDDLNNSKKIILKWISNNFTHRIITKYFNKKIEVLLGYSDSCKDGGNLTSSWKIYNVQKELVKQTNEKGFEVSFFHGRGGTIGRGGGPSYHAINSQPKGSIKNKLRFTEQGEIIWAKYSNPRKAWFNFETILTATANSIVSKNINKLENDLFNKTMDLLSKKSFLKYKSLIKDNKDFEKIFFDITPIKEISKLNIGSRPASRKKTKKISNLRSIPWVFSWSQVRAMIPAWYGVGTSLFDYINETKENLERLRNWYETIPFFNSLLSNIEMVISKVDLNITECYFQFSKNKSSNIIFREILEEFNKVKNSILLISNKSELLEDYEDFKINLEYRLPYLNILNYFQLELIKRSKKNKKNKISLKEAILISINGIATGLRNSG